MVSILKNRVIRLVIFMFKFFNYLFLFFFLANCAAPGTALLSPVITGATTKSAQQGSLSLVSSLSSKKIIEDHDKDLKSLKQSIFQKSKKLIKKY